MKTLLLLSTFIFGHILAQAQCDYVWKSQDNRVHVANYLENPKIKFDSLNSLLSKVVENVKFIRIDEKSAEWVDSFKTGKISDTAYLPYLGKAFFARGNNVWWLEVTFNNVGYLLTKVDTIKSEGKNICVYKLSTNLISSWNIDFDNWVFLYSKEFGIMKYWFESIIDPNFEDNYILIDNSCVTYKPIFKSIVNKYGYSVSNEK